MKLAGTKLVILLTSILLSSMSYADLRMPELAMELILKKSIHQNREIIQFEVKFTNQAGKYEDMFVRDADRPIVEDLKECKALVKIGKIKHK